MKVWVLAFHLKKKGIFSFSRHEVTPKKYILRGGQKWVHSCSYGKTCRLWYYNSFITSTEWHSSTAHLLSPTPIQIKALLCRCVLAKVQVDLNLSSDFSHLCDSKENPSSTAALGNFSSHWKPKQICFLKYYYKVNIINCKVIRDNNAFHVCIFLSKPSVLNMCYSVSLYNILTK